MSSRWYPIYQKGNPQLRVFLPNFYMKLVHNKMANVPSNRIEFHVSMGMSKHDIKQYLQKIYNVPVVDVHTLIQQGVFKKAPGKNYIIKEDDYKRAFVILPKDYKFEFPDIFPKEKINQEIENEKKLKETVEADHKKAKEKQRLRPDVPRWFA